MLRQLASSDSDTEPDPDSEPDTDTEPDSDSDLDADLEPDTDAEDPLVSHPTQTGPSGFSPDH